MAEQNMQSLDAVVEQTIELAHQAIEQTRAEIARSQALSQAEAISPSPSNTCSMIMTSVRMSNEVGLIDTIA